MTKVHVEVEMGPEDTLTMALREACPVSEESLAAWIHAQDQPLMAIARVMKKLADLIPETRRPQRVVFDFTYGGEPEVIVESDPTVRLHSKFVP